MIRLSWKIANASGHGDWLPYSAESLKEIICDLNTKYGAGTHWIENAELPRVQSAQRKEPSMPETAKGNGDKR